MVSASSFERDIDITKAIKEDLADIIDVLYDAIQVSLSRQFATNA